MSVRVVRTVEELRRELRPRRRAGQQVAVVPTMGALHAGHLSLVQQAKRFGDLVVVSIFVNPTQFGPGEDFDKYPRDLEADLRLLEEVGADYVFAPGVAEMYPKGEQTRVVVADVSRGLCGAMRPGHFEGVATVVSKLFNAVGEGSYLFGEKDYQQLRVIQAMAKDLLVPVTIVGCPIVREADGLAMSSRNAYLGERERAVAPGLYAGLKAAQKGYQSGERGAVALWRLAADQIERSAIGTTTLELEYLEIRDAADLSSEITDGHGQLVPFDRRVVILVAARIGHTRLIDNLVF